MSKNIQVGDFIGFNTDFLSDTLVWSPVTNEFFSRPMNYTSLATNEDFAPIHGTGDFICGSGVEGSLEINHSDGSHTVLPASGGTGAIQAVASSADGSTFAFLSGTSDHVTVYTHAGLALLHRIPLTEAIATTNIFVALNSDGSKVAVMGSGKKLEVFATATGVSDFKSGTNRNVRDLAWNPHDSKWMIVDSGQELYIIDSGGDTLQESNIHTGNKPYRGFTMTPDETVLVSAGHLAGGSVKAFLMATYADIPIVAPAGLNAHYAWANDTDLYCFTTAATQKEIHHYIWDGTTMSAPTLIGYHGYANPTGRFFHGSKWEVNGVITDTAEDDTFIVSLWTMDGRSMVGQQHLASGVVAFACPCMTSAPVMVVITGDNGKFHETDAEYLTGEKVFVGDTKYMYECTTAGITASTKPAYPTSGTITDGSAVFNTLNLIAKPVTNAPVYPTVV